MDIICTPFGKTAAGQPVERYTLTDGSCSASILTLGGVLQSLNEPARKGTANDLLQGFDTQVADQEPA